MKIRTRFLIPLAAIFAGVSTALAGPVIIDGTDANDHGSVSGGVNQAGWLYMQKALENVGGQVGNGKKIVVDLGTSLTSIGGTTSARSSIVSAFGLSSLVGAGWTLVHVDGDANIASFLAGNTVNNVSLATAGLLYLPTYSLASGDLTSAEMAAINAGAAAIASFVGGAGNPATGGGLFSQGQSGTGAYGWLTTLIPGLVATNVGGGGVGTNITLTTAGAAAFPGLTNTQLAGADPWHGYFSGNLGSLSVLGTATETVSGVMQTRNIIIGGGAGTVINPNPPSGVPDSSSTLALLSLGLLGLAALRRRLTA